jgi:hypothetical protein
VVAAGEIFGVETGVEVVGHYSPSFFEGIERRSVSPTGTMVGKAVLPIFGAVELMSIIGASENLWPPRMLSGASLRLNNVVLSSRAYSRFTRSIRAAVTLSTGNLAKRSSVPLRVPATKRHGRSVFSGPRIPIFIGFAEGLAPSDAQVGLCTEFSLYPVGDDVAVGCPSPR